MKVKIITAVLMASIVSASGVAGNYYLKAYKKNVESEKVYLQERVSNLDEQNKVLKNEVNNLVKKNEKATQSIKKMGEQTKAPKQTNATATDKKKIEGLVWANLQKQGISSKFTKVVVKQSGIWATADAIPKDITKYDGLTYLFKQKDNGTWEMLNFGTGFSRNDYPESPAEIWN